MTATIVILLRAVNVGGHNKVPMARLREHLAELGASDVSTYIASGNIICRPPGPVGDFTGSVEDLITREFGVTTVAIARTNRQLRAARDAYPWDVHEPRFCAIAFARDAPRKGAAAALSALDLGEDRVAVKGKQVHVRYANGVQGSKLTNTLIDRAVGTACTARNVRTVDTLIELSG